MLPVLFALLQSVGGPGAPPPARPTPPTALPLVMARLVLDGLAGIRFLLQRKPEHTWAIVRAHFAFYGRLHRAVLAPDPFPRGWPSVGVYRGSLVWRALVRKKTTAPPL